MHIVHVNCMLQSIKVMIAPHFIRGLNWLSTAPIKNYWKLRSLKQGKVIILYLCRSEVLYRYH